jgi:hypothetical protein
LKTSADTIAAMPLIGNEVGIVAVRELIAMVLVEYFGLLRHQTRLRLVVALRITPRPQVSDLAASTRGVHADRVVVQASTRTPR